MNVFQTHSRIVSDYETYIHSFLRIADPKIREVVEGELNQGKLWPQPLLQLNPSFRKFGSLNELTDQGVLHSDIRDIFKGFTLYRHQVEAINLVLHPSCIEGCSRSRETSGPNSYESGYPSFHNGPSTRHFRQGLYRYVRNWIREVADLHRFDLSSLAFASRRARRENPLAVRSHWRRVLRLQNE